MEELQLSLTPTRVEQRNAGIWLQSWQVGQTLQALVTDVLPSKQLVLSIANQQITATTDIPVQKGALLMLEVSKLHPMPVLKILHNENDKRVPLTRTQASLQEQLQQLLPRQNSVTSLLKQLFTGPERANNLSFSTDINGVLEQIRNNLPSLSEMRDYRVLQRVLFESGVFYEALLKRQLTAQNPVHAFDLKAHMFRLLRLLQQDVSGEHKTPGQVKGEAIEKWQKLIEGALADITVRQLAVLDTGKPGITGWYFEVPFLVEEDLHDLAVLIEQETNSENNADESGRWKVLLNLDVAPLGNVDVSLTLRDTQLWIVFVSELQQTADGFAQYSEQLKESLSRGGLQTVMIRSEQGVGQMPFKKQLPGVGLDEVV